MNPLHSLGAAMLAGLMAFGASAAVKDLPVKTINGKPYHYYKVPDHETVYSVLYKLGISKDELLGSNPAVADGLKPGMILYFPKQEASSADMPAVREGVVKHNVQRGETIMGIGRKYGLSVAEVIAQNPFLKDGLKAGQTLDITLPSGVAAPAPAPAVTSGEADRAGDAIEMTGYLVKKGETLYSIAASHGITPADIEAANPNLGVLKKGQVLSLPLRKQAVSPSGPASDTPEAPGTAEAPSAPSVTVGAPEPAAESAAPAEAAKPAEVSVAVMLPFMLSEETPSKAAQRTTEFYKGFLLAADSLRASSTPVRIVTFDTEDSPVKVGRLLADPAMSKFSAIVAPDDASQLALIAEFGKDNHIPVLNPFVVRDESYLYNPFMLQGNLPTRQMYAKAVKAFADRLERSVPVFVSLKGGHADKAEFVAELKKELASRSIASRDIEADGSLAVSDLAGLPADGSYTFIPLSGRQADLNRMLPAIIEWRDQSGMPLVRLFGYPEWITYRGETLSNMHNLNTTVYSRIFADYDDRRSEALETEFRRWYGTRMECVVPRQGLMGFDAGMFLIPYLQNGTAVYDGIQNGFRVVSAGEGKGSYNDMLYLINFRPGGGLDKTQL
ncbi:MAG: LysM peptidoglycan-binding domain-containing protein [Duncaniella sp.]|nr:LysM peptidoglycan-binding domain-containing protein [Duncaniella sp.]